MEEAGSDDEEDADDRQYKKPLLPLEYAEDHTPQTKSPFTSRCGSFRVMAALSLAFIFALVLVHWPSLGLGSGCDTFQNGYNCNSKISHFWGQYSAYFSIDSNIPTSVPKDCKLTFVQILSRHGGRYPTASKTVAYNQTVQQIQSNVKTFAGKYSFLADYVYDLGADNLTQFGKHEMSKSGQKFYRRYQSLARLQAPFVRASGEFRVVDSAQHFIKGFHQQKADDPKATLPDGYPYNIVLISEDSGSNNTLDHGTCTNFEEGQYDYIPDSKDNAWISYFVPPIQARLNKDLPGANLSATQTIYMMDLCPFTTLVDRSPKKLSAFCDLFTQNEWSQYNYYQSVDKYYSYGNGNPLGPTQGVGFTNELIARLTHSPVRDETSTNHTLDENPGTFPVGKHHSLFADFSHDTQMTSIFSAMGLYNNTNHLTTDHIMSAEKADGYSAAWVTPFAARAYFEKMQCKGQDEELIRVLVNDRVVPLLNCDADSLGRCIVKKWVKSLSFARQGGRWNECFNSTSTQHHHL